MKNKIVEIFMNINTNAIYVKTKNDKRERSLYKDDFGYFCRIEKYNDKWLVDRFTDPGDIKKIEMMLKEAEK